VWSENRSLYRCRAALLFLPPRPSRSRSPPAGLGFAIGVSEDGEPDELAECGPPGFGVVDVRSITMGPGPAELGESIAPSWAIGGGCWGPGSGAPWADIGEGADISDPLGV
jgi:hypothetical protein